MSKKYNNFKGGLKTIPEYSEFIPPMSDKDFNQLKDNIKQDGIIRPLVIDEGGTILDGHARYKIAEMLDIDFKTVVKKVNNIEEGRLWIIKNAMGRRTLTTSELKKVDDLVAGITSVNSKTVKPPISHIVD